MLPLCGINENLLYTLTKRFNLGYNSMVCIESILSALHGFFWWRLSDSKILNKK